jgi:hypothetical protein
LKATSATPPFTWPAVSALSGFGWQMAQSYLATCWVCAPTRMGSAPLAQVALGGAPVLLSLPPWHITQFCFQLVTPAGRPWLWQVAQAGAVPWPSSVAPWQMVHSLRPAFAAGAWNPALAGSDQERSWPVDSMVPSRCVPAAPDSTWPCASTDVV